MVLFLEKLSFARIFLDSYQDGPNLLSLVDTPMVISTGVKTKLLTNLVKHLSGLYLMMEVPPLSKNYIILQEKEHTWECSTLKLRSSHLFMLV
jgi:hypothetical protein